MAGRFTHYGVFLALLIIGWVVWASRSSSGVSRSEAPAFLVFVAGVVLLLLLTLIGVVCSVAATTPMVEL